MRIVPTIGRVVHFWPAVHYLEQRPADAQPQAAIVAYVHGEECVNLAVFSPGGEVTPMTSVRLQQTDSDPIDPRDAHATWMPFQVGQAKAQAATPPAA
jgi:hypothetical protein